MNTKLLKYIKKERGRLTQLANATNSHASDVCNWAQGKRKVPLSKGLLIEYETGGEVTRQDLFPREIWRSVWPELDKRKGKL